jgi:hypothetical protein
MFFLLLSWNSIVCLQITPANAMPSIEAVSKLPIRLKVEEGYGAHILNISRLSPLDPTKRLGLRGGFETASKKLQITFNIDFAALIHSTNETNYEFMLLTIAQNKN